MRDGMIADKINKLFDLRPYSIVERFGLKNPIFLTNSFLRDISEEHPLIPLKYFENGVETSKVEFYKWEKLDYVEKIKKEFNL